MAILNILRTFGKFYDNLVHFVLIWYIFPSFGITYQQKSGNPALVASQLGTVRSNPDEQGCQTV
jgi:hypothetical protein